MSFLKPPEKHLIAHHLISSLHADQIHSGFLHQQWSFWWVDHSKSSLMVGLEDPDSRADRIKFIGSLRRMMVAGNLGRGLWVWPKNGWILGRGGGSKAYAPRRWMAVGTISTQCGWHSAKSSLSHCSGHLPSPKKRLRPKSMSRQKQVIWNGVKVWFSQFPLD